MGKFADLKHAMKNPPPERLAAIEYRSHFLQMIGISVVCTFLIIKGFWYIIFAFIFGVGISYSQGMSAYMKYKMIKSLTTPEKPEDFEKDISFTRRRSKVINHVFGSWGVLGSATFAVISTVLIVNPYSSRWVLMIAYPISLFVFFFVYHYFIIYWIAKLFFNKEVKK